MSLYQFAAVIHARPPQTAPGRTFILRNRDTTSLAFSPSDLTRTFERTFEQVAAALEQLPRMFFEPDGSFVWVSSAGEPAWQLDGMLYDRDGRVLHIDLKGACPPAEFDALLTTLGWPATPVVVQLSREAVFLDEAEFRRYAVS